MTESPPPEEIDDRALGIDGGLLGRVIERLRSDPRPTWWLTRLAFLRGLGFIYLIAFLIAANQAVPLLGEHGILPAQWHLDDLRFAYGSSWQGFLERPSLFWIDASDTALRVVSWAGVVLSVALMLGVSHVAVTFLLWALYLSIVHVGQIFWGYGWETLLLETGFLAMFLCPTTTWRPLRTPDPPSGLVTWLLRWVLFRLMFGAGLIKLRGDECWTDLTCLEFHYETQPVPSPMSAVLHDMPAWFHTGGVLFNHFVELVVPFFLFAPRRLRHVAGGLIVVFQVMLIVSGNLSFLNWLTLVVALAAFDDQLLSRLAPRRLRGAVAELARRAEPSRPQRWAVVGLAGLVAVLSVMPVANLLSSRQAMNASFDRLHLVNTYGAFGSIGRERYEVVLEGTRAAEPDGSAEWREYELPCKPGDPARRPCLITPYHHRLDWQMWFAALSDYERQPWIVRLVYLLLEGEPSVKRLLAHDPFPGRPPTYVRARLFRYEFDPDGPGWWRREPAGPYLRPLSLDDPALREFLEDYGLLPPEQN